MNPSNFASGEELYGAKNRTQVLPSWGEKQGEPSGSWMEEKQVKARLQDCQELISELRVARKDQLATGRWIKESNVVQLIQQTGSFWEYMGVETDIGRCLYPEEAVYLIEMGELEVDHGGMPLSIQAAQAVMLKDSYHQDQYLVYAHLARTGCKVVRHQPHLRFTRYEKQIRLDQHQAKKRKRKLKLKGNNKETEKTVPDTVTAEVKKTPQVNTETIEVIDLDSPNLDDAMKEFYSSLGDEIAVPSESDNKQSRLPVPEEGRKFEWNKCASRSENVNEYELKKKEYLDMFPSMLGTSVQTVKIEDADLYPGDVEPLRDCYEVSLDVLNYYSKYFEDGQQNDQPYYEQNQRWQRGRGNFRGMRRNGNFRRGLGYGQNSSYGNRGKKNNRYNDSGWHPRRDQQDSATCGNWDHQENEPRWPCDRKDQFRRGSRGGGGGGGQRDGNRWGQDAKWNNDRRHTEIRGNRGRGDEGSDFTGSRYKTHDNRVENDNEGSAGFVFDRKIQGVEDRWGKDAKAENDRWDDGKVHLASRGARGLNEENWDGGERMRADRWGEDERENRGLGDFGQERIDFSQQLMIDERISEIRRNVKTEEVSSEGIREGNDRVREERWAEDGRQGAGKVMRDSSWDRTDDNVRCMIDATLAEARRNTAFEERGFERKDGNDRAQEERWVEDQRLSDLRQGSSRERTDDSIRFMIDARLSEARRNIAVEERTSEGRMGGNGRILEERWVEDGRRSEIRQGLDTDVNDSNWNRTDDSVRCMIDERLHGARRNITVEERPSGGRRDWNGRPPEERWAEDARYKEFLQRTGRGMGDSHWENFDINRQRTIDEILPETRGNIRVGEIDIDGRRDGNRRVQEDGGPNIYQQGTYKGGSDGSWERTDYIRQCVTDERLSVALERLRNGYSSANKDRLGENEGIIERGNRVDDWRNAHRNNKRHQLDESDCERKMARVDTDVRWMEDRRALGDRWDEDKKHLEPMWQGNCIDGQRMGLNENPMHGQGSGVDQKTMGDNRWRGENREAGNISGGAATPNDNEGNRVFRTDSHWDQGMYSGAKRLEGCMESDRHKNEWYQHDDRSSPGNHDENVNSSPKPEKPTIDLSVVPQWKTKRRKRRRDRGVDTYPSYLVKLPVQVHSWKEYKGIVNSMSEDNMLTQGLGQALWRGPVVPLLKPLMASSLQNVLSKCTLLSNENDNSKSLPEELHLILHFDVYLPNTTYKKSSPSIPSKRITVIRDGEVPSYRQITEVALRFPDEAPVVSAVVISGEVRLYTLAPLTLPPPVTT